MARTPTAIPAALLRLCLLIIVPLACLCAETYDEVVAKTDMSDANSIIELAQWCQAHQRPTLARSYYVKVIRLDTDNEVARAALGEVKVGEHWVPARLVKRGPGKAGGGGSADGKDPEIQAAGPGPTAAQIPWNLTLPPDPAPDNHFLDQYINALPTYDNDSRDMDAAINTFQMPENLPIAIPRLCAALKRPDFNDLYGACTLAMNLINHGQFHQAKILLPFLVTASSRITIPDDLSTFAYVAGMFKDRRVIPRLIELLGSPDKDVHDNAVAALAQLTVLPQRDITVEKVTNWWDLNHAVSDSQIYEQQLGSHDPQIAMEAAEALYDLRDPALMPVAIRLLNVDDVRIRYRASALIEKVTGSTWNYHSSQEPAVRKERADAILKWWNENKDDFTWMADRKTVSKGGVTTAAVDPTTKMVKDLGSVTGNTADQAEASLVGEGNAAVPALIVGLADSSNIVARKCEQLLRTITKQAIAYDPYDTQAKRTAAINAWTAWARTKGLIKTPAEDGGAAGVAGATSVAPAGGHP